MKGVATFVCGFTAALGLAFAIGAIAVACTPAQTAGGINLAVCILQTYSTDIAAGESDTAAIADTIAKCGTDAVAVGTVLDASRGAESRMAAAKKAK